MALRVALLCALLAPFALAQSVSLPHAGPAWVDYSKDLEQPSLVVVVGRLDKWKEGKREKLADGKLGGGGAVAVVSGTQFHKAPVTAALLPRATLHGKADKVSVQFDVQIARLPDGKEQRQVLGAAGTALAEDTLALFVLLPRPKQKGLDLLHVLPFRAEQHRGSDPEAAFADAMRDVHTVNLRLQALERALAAVDAARDDAARTKALAALRTVLDAKPELLQPANDGLLTQHAGPLEQRAKKRLDDAAAKSGEAATGK